MPHRAWFVRIRRRALAVACAALAVCSSAHACGPDFPPTLLDQRESALLQLPEGIFMYEAGRLYAAPSDALRAKESWDLMTEVEPAGLTPEQAEAIAAMRAAASVEAAEAAGASLPEDVRLYTAGAVAWNLEDKATALDRFRRVLALPAAERARRGLWASFMEARALEWNGDHAGAIAAYERTREWARNGVDDPLGLAVASYGQQARIAWTGGDWGTAVQLYAEQASRDSQSGKQSLLEVARRGRDDPQTLDALLADPYGRSLMVVYLFARSGELTADAGTDYDEDGDVDEEEVDAERAPRTSLTAAALLSRIAEHAATMPAVDRLAAVAYRAGLYGEAEQFAKASPWPLAAWVRAKLALRSGNVDAAAAAYAEAIKGFPQDESWGEQAMFDGEDYLGYETLTPACRVSGEAGALALSRGDFVQALELLYGAADVYPQDAAYVAERVVTVDELRTFVDRVAPEAKPAAPDDYGYWYAPADKGAAMRWLLARRLMRAERYDDALKYFDNAEVRAAAERYAAARRAAADEDGVDRARALFDAAKIARSDGMELLGYDGDPDYFFTGGGYDLNDPTTWDEDYNPIHNPRTDLPVTGPFTSDAERERLAQSRAQPLERFHYRLTASQLAAQAADALPPRSQAFAAVLCEGTHWLIDRHYDAAQALYRRYLREGPYVPWGASFGRECPAPDFDKVERELRAQFIAKAKKVAMWAAPPVLLLLVLGGWVVAMRRKRKAAA